MKNQTIYWLPLSLLVILVFSACLFSAPTVTSDAEPISHESFDSLLGKYVDETGMVDYIGLATERTNLDAYLNKLSTNPPDTKTWTKEEQMAYWINAYNAFTLQIILDNYPVASIKDIKNGIPFVNTVWDIKFFKIGDKDFDLNNIEHGILRKMDDPRIHFALVCASLSCPKLQPFAYHADKLEQQLEIATTQFFNEPFRNEISEQKAQLSSLLKWYWGDFKDQYDEVLQLVNKYSRIKVAEGTEVSYLDYDWGINDQAQVDPAKLAGGS